MNGVFYSWSWFKFELITISRKMLKGNYAYAQGTYIHAQGTTTCSGATMTCSGATLDMLRSKTLWRTLDPLGEL